VNAAVVDRPENADKGEFLETIAQNAGHSFNFLPILMQREVG